MFTSDPRDELALGLERARRFREERVADRLGGADGVRRVLAAWFRRAANRLDPPALIGLGAR